MHVNACNNSLLKMFTICSIMSLYTVYNVQCTVYNVHYTVYNVQYTVYNVQYTVYNVHYTVYNVQCIMNISAHVNVKFYQFTISSNELIGTYHCQLTDNDHCIVYSYTLYSVHYTLYSV